MLKTTPKLLRDAKAGNYKPSTFGIARDFLQSSSKQVAEGLVGSDIVVLDISFYQLTADFQKMLDNGVKGVIIRAGQNKWEDSKAKEFMSNAKMVGMPIGSYWFYDSRVEPSIQAEKWKEVLGDAETALYCWADYEENYGGTYKGWKSFYDFLEACKREMPNRKFGIYTGYYYWLEHSPLTTASLNYFGQYPLWEAWYTDDPSTVKIPKPWTKMLFWQKSSSGDGAHYGVGSKEVDVNLFMGTREEFENLSGTIIEEPDNGETMTQWYRVTATSGLKIRKGPGTSYVQVGSLLFNDLIETDNLSGGWVHIVRILRNGADVSVPDSQSWCSNAYCEKIAPPVDPGDPDPEPAKKHFQLKVDGYKLFEGDLEEE